MDGVPVANYNQDEDQEGDHEQTRGFRRIDGVAAILAGFGLTLTAHHADIVRQNKTRPRGMLWRVGLIISGLQLDDTADNLRPVFYALPVVVGC